MEDIIIVQPPIQWIGGFFVLKKRSVAFVFDIPMKAGNSFKVRTE